MLSSGAASTIDPSPNGTVRAAVRGERDRVAILLATYQGARFLPEQLNSFAAQTHSDWIVWASDDGSTDETRAILARYASDWPAGRLSVVDGPQRGFAANFFSLLGNPAIVGEHFAFSDQDDLWDADKLARALEWLSRVPAGVPALYCGPCRLVDADNREIGFSPLFAKPLSFANALVQNIGNGNTMVFNLKLDRV